MHRTRGRERPPAGVVRYSQRPSVAELRHTPAAACPKNPSIGTRLPEPCVRNGASENARIVGTGHVLQVPVEDETCGTFRYHAPDNAHGEPVGRVTWAPYEDHHWR